MLLDLTARPVIGHRGNRAFAPENTIESFRQALALGADAIELDVHATRDGEVVVMHDETLDRTTDGTGAVAEQSWSAIATLDAGARFTRDGGRTRPYRGQGIGIPRLAEVLETFADARILIEIKTPLASPGVRSVVRDCHAEPRCVIASFSREALLPFADGDFKTCASRADMTRLYAPSVIGKRYTSLPFDAISIPRMYRGLPLPIAAVARAVRPAGVPVHVWTVNDPAVALRLWARGVCGIISDDPGAMLRVRPA